MNYNWKPLEKTDESFCFDAFSVPILQIQLDLDVEQLEKFCFDLWKKNNKGEQKSNVGGWQSSNIIPDQEKEQHPEFQKLLVEIYKCLFTYQSRIGFKKEYNPTIIDGWINFNEKNDYNMWHIHGGNDVVFSSAYYVKVDDPQSGPIMFRHPFAPYLSIIWKENKIEKKNMSNSDVMGIFPKSNLLLLFPSWLQHSVFPNNTNNTRISMSFNTILNKW